MKNSDYSKENVFVDACKKANAKCTTRQESKFRNGKGIAYMVSVLKSQEPLRPGMPGYEDWGSL